MSTKNKAGYERILLDPIPNGLAIVGSFAGVLVLVVLVIGLLSETSVVEGSSSGVGYNMRTCEMEGSQARSPLRVYVLNHVDAGGFLERLCGHPEIKRRYDGVEVVWQHELAERYLALQGQFQILAAPPAVISSSPVGAAALEPIAAYADYEVIWLGRFPDQGLGRDALGTMRIGLRASPLSVSGRLVPEAHIRSLGADPRSLDIRLYRRHSELRDALLAGDVDLIATFWDESSEDSELSRFDRQFLDWTQGVHWYVDRSLVDTPIHCLAEEIIRDRAEGQDSPYFARLELIRPCTQ
jgi:hypothetical protein